MKRSRFSLVLLLTAVLLLAPAAGHARQVKLSNEVAWVMGADTYQCCVQQSYANAMNRLKELSQGKTPGSWCVILDADETIISNVGFQAELQAAGAEYSKTAWDAWCRRAEATALAGAKEFCRLAQELGGKVIIITNRQGHLKDVTLKNLDAQGITYDACLLREGPYAFDRSKTIRRSAVKKGTIKTLPLGEKFSTLEIVMLVGDQTHDLYDSKNLSFNDVRDRFAKDLVVIPNPMYGDWARPGVFFDTLKPAAKPETGERVSTAITWQEAMSKLGQEVEVEAKIVSVYDPEPRGKKGPVKLNVAYDYKTSLTFAFYKKDREGREKGFGDPNRFLHKTVRVRGKVSEFKGSKQIMLQSASDIEVIE